jgi:hypothetical protein
MKLNLKTIVIAGAVGVAAYYLFFKKKATTNTPIVSLPNSISSMFTTTPTTTPPSTSGGTTSGSGIGSSINNFFNGITTPAPAMSNYSVPSVLVQNGNSAVVTIARTAAETNNNVYVVFGIDTGSASFPMGIQNATEKGSVNMAAGQLSATQTIGVPQNTTQLYKSYIVSVTTV